MEKYLKLKNTFKNKKVIVTGHTGFKGSWLTFWLIKNNANVFGISNNVPSIPSHYKNLKLSQKLKEYFFNIQDYKRLNKVVLGSENGRLKN